VTTLKYRLQYVVWAASVLSLAAALSVSSALAQRGQPGSASREQTPPTLPAQAGQAQAGPPRQGPPAPRPGSGWGEWWKDELVIKELQLSSQKARRIDQIFQERSKRMAAVAEELPVEQKKLDQMAAERVVDESTFALQVARVVFLRSRRDESRAVMLYRIHLELTPEQYKKLRDLQERSRVGRGGRGGRGGPHQ